MKLGTATKLGKRNIAKLEKFGDDFMLANCDVIVVFFYRYPEAWSMKLTFLLRVTFYLTEPENRTKKPLIDHLYYCFE